MQRSPIAWLYWLLFIICIALVIALNQPWPGLPAQDASKLFVDPWFIWGFSWFGLLLMPAAALIIDDARRKNMAWWPFVIPYFVIGVIPLSVYMALRPVADRAQRETPRMLENKLFWWLCFAGTIAVSMWLLPQGSLDRLIDTMRHNLGWTFMWLDIVLNHIVVLPLAQADMRRRGVTNQTAWLIAILIAGPLGLCAYMARRPQVSGNQ
jgi:hypothetical protein